MLGDLGDGQNKTSRRRISSIKVKVKVQII
jgi:hypothetical protein